MNPMSKEVTPITLVSNTLRHGVTISKEKTYYKTFEKWMSTNILAFQFLTCSPKDFKPPTFEEGDLKKTRKLLKHSQRYVMIHGKYMYNMCGSTDPNDSQMDFKLKRVIECLGCELDLGVGLGDISVVIHFGSCKDKKIGTRVMINTIKKILDTPSKYTSRVAKSLKITEEDLLKRRRLLLENSSGEGTKLGSTLESIGEIYRGVGDMRVKVCIDTCHAFAAGVCDFGDVESITQFFLKFEELIGIENLEVFHLNDSEKGFGSKADLHECLGLGMQFSEREGKLGLSGLSFLLKFAEKHRIPLISETKSGKFDRAVVCSISDMEVVV